MKDGGLIHIYCGNGKGKTTTAMGLAVRCAGHGNKVLIVQFLKSWKTGELNSLALIPTIEVMRAKGSAKFTYQMTEEEKQQIKNEHLELFAKAKEKCFQEKIDMLVLDEIVGACDKEVFDKEILLEFLHNKPQELEVIMTGRNPFPEIVELADYISEICPHKHPFERGIPARIGVER